MLSAMTNFQTVELNVAWEQLQALARGEKERARPAPKKGSDGVPFQGRIFSRRVFAPFLKDLKTLACVSRSIFRWKSLTSLGKGLLETSNEQRTVPVWLFQGTWARPFAFTSQVSK